jgi:outer membrane receptor for ferrienterochelin and colicin
VGTTAAATAVSTGRPVEQVKPETSVSCEGGVHYRAKRVSTDFYAFVNNVYDNIAYQALVLPQGADTSTGAPPNIEGARRPRMPT